MHSEIQGYLESKEWDEAKKVAQFAMNKLKSVIFSDMEIQSYDRSLPTFLRAYTAGSVHTRTVWLGVDAYQKTKSFEESNDIIEFLLSQTIYLTHYRGRWHERYITNSKHTKQVNRVLRKFIKIALDDPFLGESHRFGLSVKLERYKSDEMTKNTKKNRGKGKSTAVSSDEEDEDKEEGLCKYNPDDFAICVLRHKVPETSIQGEKMSV